MHDYPALVPKWTPKIKTKVPQGSGLAKRYFGAKPDGSHGESKRGWSTVDHRRK